MNLTRGSHETIEDGQGPVMLPALKMDKRSHMPRGEAVKGYLEITFSAQKAKR